MSKRVLFVDQSGQLGGAELSLLDLASRTRHQGSVVLFDDGPFRPRLEARGIAVEVLKKPSGVEMKRDGGALQMLMSAPGYGRLVMRLTYRARRSDLLYANTQKAFVLSAFASVLTRRPLIWHLRDILSREHFSARLVQLSVTLANQCAYKVIANSRASADAFVAAGGSPTKVEVIYNGFDVSAFAFDRQALREQLRCELRLAGQPMIGVFSRLAHWKGQHIALEAVSKIPGLHLLLVGGPLFGEEKYETFLKTRSAELGIANRVHFMGFRNDVLELMAAVDMAAHTSIAPEPFGRVIVEAMMCGTPVIVPAAGGAAELVENQVTGRTFVPGQPDSLLSVIHESIDNSTQTQVMASKARQWAYDSFDITKTVASADRQIDAA